MSLLLVLYVATLPLIGLELATVGGKAIVPSDLCFVALLGAATMSAAWRSPPRALTAVAALPPLAAAAAALAGSEPASAIQEIARTSYSMAILVAFASLALDEERVRLLARAWTTTAAAACVIGLTAFVAVAVVGLPPNLLARPNSPNLGAGVVRVAGVLETNALTLYLTTAAAFAAFLARAGSTKRDQDAGSLALLLMAFTALVSFSRGAVGFWVAAALLAFQPALAPRWLGRARAGVAALATLLALAGLLATLWAVFPVSFHSGASGGLAVEWNTRPNAYRVLHAAGLRMFAAHAFVGVGAGAFGARFGEFTTEEERSRAWPPLDPAEGRSPHSTWIGLAAEGGIVLVAAWMVLSGWLLRALLARRPAASLAAFAGPFFAGLLMNGLHIELHHLKFVWAAAGLALGTAYSDSNKYGAIRFAMGRDRNAAVS